MNNSLAFYVPAFLLGDVDTLPPVVIPPQTNLCDFNSIEQLFLAQTDLAGNFFGAPLPPSTLHLNQSFGRHHLPFQNRHCLPFFSITLVLVYHHGSLPSPFPE